MRVCSPLIGLEQTGIYLLLSTPMSHIILILVNYHLQTQRKIYVCHLIVRKVIGLLISRTACFFSSLPSLLLFSFCLCKYIPLFPFFPPFCLCPFLFILVGSCCIIQASVWETVLAGRQAGSEQNFAQQTLPPTLQRTCRSGAGILLDIRSHIDRCNLGALPDGR